MIKLLKIFILVIVSFCLCSCTFERGLILFNTQPVTRENALQDQKVFNEGQRVYYLFIAPKKMNNEFIRVQVFKMTDKAPWGGNEVVRTKDYRLCWMKDTIIPIILHFMRKADTSCRYSPMMIFSTL